MSILAILTLVAAGFIVAALAAYLIAITVLLRKTLSTLGTVHGALRTIGQRVEPIGPVLTDLNADLERVRDSLESVVNKAETKEKEAAS